MSAAGRRWRGPHGHERPSESGLVKFLSSVSSKDWYVRGKIPEKKAEHAPALEALLDALRDHLPPAFRAGAHAGPGAHAPAAAYAPAPGHAAPPPPPQPAHGAPPPPPPPSNETWMLSVNGQQFGPYDRAAVAGMVRARQIDPAACFTWTQGMPEWLPFLHVPALAALAAAPPPPPPGTPSPPPMMPPPPPGRPDAG